MPTSSLVSKPQKSINYGKATEIYKKDISQKKINPS
jgi:hypothetical protein